MATLLGLAEALLGKDSSNISVSPAAADVVLAEKALTVVETCLTGST